MPRRCPWYIALLLGAQGASAVDMRINTAEQPPYQYFAQGQLTGSLVHTVQCIADQLNEQWDITLVPWARALHNFRDGKVQGLFPVYRAPAWGQLTTPLTIERWLWFSSGNADGARIGAVRGSNQHEWLQANHIAPAILVNTELQLLKLLLQGRIDRFLGDERSIRTLADSNGLAIDHWQHRFVRFAPLYLAVRQDLTGSAVRFDRINQMAGVCARETMGLTEAETRTTLAAVEQLKAGLQALAEPALTALSPADAVALSEREAIWQKTAMARNPHIDQSLSNALTRWQASQAAVAEVIVMGPSGETVAAADKPSDYWQGDEAKFQKTRNLGSGEYFVEPIAYDPSTQEFITHINWPLYLQGTFAGAISLGIRIEKLISGLSDACAQATKCQNHSGSE